MGRAQRRANSMVGTEQLSSEDLLMMRYLHRRPDGFISFAVQSGDDWRGFALRSDVLETHHTKIPFDISKDSYVSINAALGCKGRGAPVGYGLSNHRTDTMRYLCACYCDIDLHDETDDRAADTVIQALFEREHSGIIPPMSLCVRSGRGIWALWFLYKEQGGLEAPRAWPEAINQHRQLQEALALKLQELGADLAVLDTVRHLRLPGSLNTKSETHVKWYFRFEARYTLAELGEMLGIKATNRKFSPSKAVPESREEEEQRSALALEKFDRMLWDDEYWKSQLERAEKKQGGYFALLARRLKDLLVLTNHRGGIRTGCRNNAAYLLAIILRAYGCDQAKAQAYMNNLRSELFKPALSQREACETLKSAYSNQNCRKVKDLLIGKWLNITPQENKLLEGDYLGLKRKELPSRSISDAQRVTARQDAIREIVGDGAVPSTREMAERLIARGIRVSHVIVSKDYKALGLKTGALPLTSVC